MSLYNAEMMLIRSWQGEVQARGHGRALASALLQKALELPTHGFKARVTERRVSDLDRGMRIRNGFVRDCMVLQGDSLVFGTGGQ